MKILIYFIVLQLIIAISIVLSSVICSLYIRIIFYFWTTVEMLPKYVYCYVLMWFKIELFLVLLNSIAVLLMLVYQDLL